MLPLPSDDHGLPPSRYAPDLSEDNFVRDADFGRELVDIADIGREDASGRNPPPSPAPAADASTAEWLEFATRIERERRGGTSAMSRLCNYSYAHAARAVAAAARVTCLVLRRRQPVQPVEHVDQKIWFTFNSDNICTKHHL